MDINNDSNDESSSNTSSLVSSLENNSQFNLYNSNELIEIYKYIELTKENIDLCKSDLARDFYELPFRTKERKKNFFFCDIFASNDVQNNSDDECDTDLDNQKKNNFIDQNDNSEKYGTDLKENVGSQKHILHDHPKIKSAIDYQYFNFDDIHHLNKVDQTVKKKFQKKSCHNENGKNFIPFKLKHKFDYKQNFLFKAYKEKLSFFGTNKSGLEKNSQKIKQNTDKSADNSIRRIEYVGRNKKKKFRGKGYNLPIAINGRSYRICKKKKFGYKTNYKIRCANYYRRKNLFSSPLILNKDCSWESYTSDTLNTEKKKEKYLKEKSFREPLKNRLYFAIVKKYDGTNIRGVIRGVQAVIRNRKKMGEELKKIMSVSRSLKSNWFNKIGNYINAAENDSSLIKKDMGQNSFMLKCRSLDSISLGEDLFARKLSRSSSLNCNFRFNDYVGPNLGIMPNICEKDTEIIHEVHKTISDEEKNYDNFIKGESLIELNRNSEFSTEKICMNEVKKTQKILSTIKSLFYNKDKIITSNSISTDSSQSSVPLASSLCPGKFHENYAVRGSTLGSMEFKNSSLNFMNRIKCIIKPSQNPKDYVERPESEKFSFLNFFQKDCNKNLNKHSIFEEVSIKSSLKSNFIQDKIYCIQTITLHHNPVLTSIAFCPKNCCLSASDQRGYIYIWYIKYHLDDHEVLGGGDFFSLVQNDCDILIDAHVDAIINLHWANNITKHRIISSSLDKRIKIFDLKISRNSYSQICNIQCEDFPSSAIFHPVHQNLIYAGCLDCTVNVWNLMKKSDEKVYHSLLIERTRVPDLVTSISISPNGVIIAVGLKNGSIIFYKADNLQFCFEVDCRNRKGRDSCGRKVTSLIWSKSGSLLCVASSDSRIRMIDVTDLSVKAKFKGHKNEQLLLQAHLSDDQDYVVCGSEDGYIYIWNTNHSGSSALKNWVSVSSKKTKTNLPYGSFKAFNDGSLSCCFIVPRAITKNIHSRLMKYVDPENREVIEGMIDIVKSSATQNSSSSNSVRSLSESQANFLSYELCLVAGSSEGKVKFFWNLRMLANK